MPICAHCGKLLRWYEPIGAYVHDHDGRTKCGFPAVVPVATPLESGDSESSS